MPREEAETICVVRKEHRAEVSVTETDFSVLGNRAGNTERLKSHADFSGGVGGFLCAALYSDSRAYGVRPDGVFKADGLSASHYIVAIDAVSKTDFLAFFNRRNAVFFQSSIDFVNSSFISFK